jgi:hypothetical protein
LWIVVALLGLIGLFAWIASQRGLEPLWPMAMISLVYLLLDHLPLLAAVGVAALGLGFPLRRWAWPGLRGADGLLLQLGAGLALWLWLGWCYGWAGALVPLAAWGLIAVGLLLALVQFILHRRAQALESSRLPRVGARMRTRAMVLSEAGTIPGAGAGAGALHLPWTLILLGPPLGVLVIAALCPPGTLWRVEAFAYDVLSYHLQLPREWIAAGSLRGLNHNVYSFLPSLTESGYTQLALLRGGVYPAIYTCQLFHLLLGLFAVLCMASSARRCLADTDHQIEWTGPIAGAAVVLALPWMVITGSLAYNEMAMLALAAAAVRAAIEPSAQRLPGAVPVGLLLGAAIMTKLTAGPMLALPIGLLLLLRGNHVLRWRPMPHWATGLLTAAVVTLTAAVVLTPYFARNALQTGNPVFPFATSWFGLGHWTPELAQRWSAGHGVAILQADHGVTFTDRVEALDAQWLRNTGYGALGGYKQPLETRNIARFDFTGGFPLFWLIVAAAAVTAMTQKLTRRLAGAMLILLAFQVAFWMWGTHLQSRFLIPTLLPAGVLLSLAAAHLRHWSRPQRGWLFPLLALALVAGLVILTLRTLWIQTLPADDHSHIIPGEIMDTLPSDAQLAAMKLDDPYPNNHALNHLPDDSRTLLVADNLRLLYLTKPFVYHSAFDADRLGALIRAHPDSPDDLTQALREEGITHVWVHWGELDRLHSTYGYDQSVTADRLAAAAEQADWRVAYALTHPNGRMVATLFALP